MSRSFYDGLFNHGIFMAIGQHATTRMDYRRIALSITEAMRADGMTIVNSERGLFIQKRQHQGLVSSTRRININARETMIDIAEMMLLRPKLAVKSLEKAPYERLSMLVYYIMKQFDVDYPQPAIFHSIPAGIDYIGE